MPGLLRSLQCFVLLMVVGTAHGAQSSVSPLTQHAVAVSQTMSAFYMFSLSEGDTRYQEEYLQRIQDADKHLAAYQKHDSVVGTELQNQWNALTPNLKFDYVDGAGHIIHLSIRNEFRRYLDMVYVKVANSISSETNLVQQLNLMALDAEAMIARFFDVSSALYGSMSVSASKDALKPEIIAKRFNDKLDRMQDMPISGQVKRKLRKVKTKWAFIEDSVINYSDKAAYLLVYYNKNQIYKALSKSQTILAGV